MIRRNQNFFNALNMVLDGILVVLAYAGASLFWLEVVAKGSSNIGEFGQNTFWLAAGYAVFFLLVLSVYGFYNTTRIRPITWKIKVLFWADTISILLVTALFYVLRLEDFSRGVVGIFYLLSLLLLIGKYVAMRLISRAIRKKGVNLKYALVIGTGPLAMQYTADVESHPDLGMRVKGYVGNSPKALCPYEDLEQVLKNSEDIDEVIIALEEGEYSRIQKIIAQCDKYGVKYYVIPFYNQIIPAHPVIETVGSSKLINMRYNLLENIGWAAIKRGFDIIASLLGLIVLSPLLLILAIGVKLSSPGPVLFKQIRVGYNRKEFLMLKFRSMRVNEKQDTAWSTNRDSRKTVYGSFIRKFSLDELPQLFNVLKGDMSLVGPRPELPHFVEKFREEIPLYMVKHQVRPGITGWAQINGFRGDTDVARRIELDLWYIDHWSIALDLKILLKTVFGGKMVNSEEIIR
ncbi:MAG: undecaprenyl-phosphate glucose phosphotransferase [Clostridiales bacterium]|nr:undecaprenyl-phosphate glucose phosphotransferase [Clostridiales bacterium]